MPRLMLLVAEVDDAPDEWAAQQRLNAFREAVRPAEEYGITLWRASCCDIGKFDTRGVPWRMIPTVEGEQDE